MTSKTRLSRRTALTVAVAGGAALAAGAWWRMRTDVLQERAAAAAAAARPAPGMQTAGTGPLLPDTIAVLGGRTMTSSDWQGHPLVLNFWAPWCAPCVKEMPELGKFAAAQARLGSGGAVILGLAIDEEANVRTFLNAHSVAFPISVLGFAGLAWVRRLSNDPNVALPFTAVFDRRGKLVQRKFGPTDITELTDWVASAA